MKKESIYDGTLEDEKICDNFIKRFLRHGEKFVKESCFPYGKYNAVVSGKVDSSFVDDFQYFVFTKSIKSLGSIKQLLKIGHIEDVFILLRTSFEGYIASRYMDEQYDITFLNDFIFIPQLITARKAIRNEEGKTVERETKEIIEFIQRDPSDMKLGKDKEYYYEFYAFLCNYAHCNFSIIDGYLDEIGLFTCANSKYQYLSKLLVIFVYIKLFESIVTVEGEDFSTDYEEKECYRLVRESTKFIYDKLSEIPKHIGKSENEMLDRHMAKMFKAMRKSLKEELGSLKKDFL